MKRWHYLSLVAVFGAAVLLAFQNCSQTQFSHDGENPFSVAGKETHIPPRNPDPTEEGGIVITPPPSHPCNGTAEPIEFNTDGLSLSFTLADASILFGRGVLMGTSLNTAGIIAQRFVLRSEDGDVIFHPGASYSPYNPSSGAVATGVSGVILGKYSLTIGPQDVGTVTAANIIATAYPLCGSTRVLWYRYKQDAGSAESDTPMTYDVTLTKPTQLIIAGEKTAQNVGNTLALSVRIQNLATSQVSGCPLNGTSVWKYPYGTGTPSVSGSCTVTLPAGAYRISNVIETDSTDMGNASQHLGILALNP